MTVAKQIIQELSPFREKFALYGAHAANLYRHTPRAASELSFALALGSAKKSKKEGDRILSDLNYSITYMWLEGLDSKAGKTVSVILGTPPANPKNVDNNESLPAVHFYLSSLPWVAKGVRRGQSVLCEMERVKIPVVALEDLIVAKAHALHSNPDASVELEDLESIFLAEQSGALSTRLGKGIDVGYLTGELNMLGLKLPAKLSGVLPEALRKVVA